jgi:hypothetical protein
MQQCARLSVLIYSGLALGPRRGSSRRQTEPFVHLVAIAEDHPNRRTKIKPTSEMIAS